MLRLSFMLMRRSFCSGHGLLELGIWRRRMRYHYSFFSFSGIQDFTGVSFCYFTLVVYYSIECWCNRSLCCFSLDIFFSVYIKDVTYVLVYCMFQLRVLKMLSIV